MHRRLLTGLSDRTRFIVAGRLTPPVALDSLMSDSQNHRKQIDSLLEALSAGDEGVMDKLMPLIERELRRLARYNLRFERRDHTLGVTALVNEAYLRLISSPSQDWKNRAYFFGAASQSMRQILVKHKRDQLRFKNLMGERKDMEVDEIPHARDRALLLLDDALNKLKRVNEAEARIVVMRYFGGLTLEETAEVMKISPSTVKRLWRHAKAWLKREMER
jgi:RNA polymerase sigma-70 factor (ECF subfamily)